MRVCCIYRTPGKRALAQPLSEWIQLIGFDATMLVHDAGAFEDNTFTGWNRLSWGTKWTIRGLSTWPEEAPRPRPWTRLRYEYILRTRDGLDGMHWCAHFDRLNNNTHSMGPLHRRFSDGIEEHWRTRVFDAVGHPRSRHGHAFEWLSDASTNILVPPPLLQTRGGPSTIGFSTSL